MTNKKTTKKNETKIYCFIQDAHYFFISKLDSKSYWIFDLCTNRYNNERWVTLEDAIEWCKKYYKELKEFSTYRELFTYILKSEMDFDIMDIIGQKNILDRKTYQDSEVAVIKRGEFFKIW